MKVYVVEKDCYASRYLAGVYKTLEGAMNANPVPLPRPGIQVRRPGGWQELEPCDGMRSWTNGLDWSDACDINEVELEP
jgi:hypothetical protein